LIISTATPSARRVWPETDNRVTVGHAREQFVGVVEAAAEFDAVIRHFPFGIDIDIFVARSALFDDGAVGNNDAAAFAEDSC